MKTHISNLVRSANFELRRISSIRHLLSPDATKIIFSAFVLLHLDHCNSLLSGCSQYLLCKLQNVQNNAACFVLRVPKTEHLAPHLASLHWLSIDTRIQYKLLFTPCYNCLNSTAPVYLTELLKLDQPSRHQRFYFDTSVLCLPVYAHALAWSENTFSCFTVCLEQCPMQSQIIKHTSLTSPLKSHLFKLSC